VSDVRDPVGMRDPIRCIQVVEKLLEGKRTLQADDLRAVRAGLSKLLASLNALDLAVDVQDDQDELTCQLLSIGQAFARGEGREEDEDGFLKLGDMATELADQLYAYATEG